MKNKSLITEGMMKTTQQDAEIGTLQAIPPKSRFLDHVRVKLSAGVAGKVSRCTGEAQIQINQCAFEFVALRAFRLKTWQRL